MESIERSKVSFAISFAGAVARLLIIGSARTTESGGLECPMASTVFAGNRKWPASQYLSETNLLCLCKAGFCRIRQRGEITTKRIRILATCIVALLAMTSAAAATENGLTEYPIGVDTVLPGIMPPQGSTVFYNYSAIYSARSSIVSGGVHAPGFSATVVVDAPRLLHTWDFMAGPFTLTSGFVQPFLHNDLSVSGLSGHTTGFYDFAAEPAYLGWVNIDHTVFIYAGIDFYLPTGRFNPAYLVNPGLNYFTFAPSAAITWFATPKLQLSLKTLSEFHTENESTHYHSGTTIDFDYSAEYAFFDAFPGIHLGVQGYYLKQLTNDTLNGITYLDGNRVEAFAIGPQVRFDWKGGGVAVKWQHELEVKNGTRGDKFWMQFSIPL